MADYLQHGRRHGPNGSDPIPGLSSGGAMVWAALGNASRVTVPAASGGSPGVKLIDMNSSIDYTNDSSVFAVNTYTSGSTYHGLYCQTAGHYLLKWQLILDAVTGTGDVSAVMFNTDGTHATPAAYGSAGRVWTRQTGDAGQDGWYLESLVTVSGAMSSPFLLQVSNNTNVSLTCDLNLVAFQLDTDSTVFF